MIVQPEEPEAPPQPPTPPARDRPRPPPAGVLAADLAVNKSAERDTCVAGAPCDFLITVTNVGRTTYVGPLQLSDTMEPGGARINAFGPSPWTCRETRGNVPLQSPDNVVAVRGIAHAVAKPRREPQCPRNRHAIAPASTGASARG